MPGAEGQVNKASNYSALTVHTLRAYQAAGVKSVVLAVEYDALRAANFWRLARKSEFSGIHFRQLARNDIGAGHRHLRTGLKLLLDVVRQKPRSVHLFGFDLYTSNTHGFGGYYRDTASPVQSTWHNTTRELIFMREFARQHRSVVTLDSHLTRVLNEAKGQVDDGCTSRGQ